jgi:hypothetical protein
LNTFNLGRESREQIERFAADVRGRRFPGPQESYGGGPAGTRPADDAVQRIYG